MPALLVKVMDSYIQEPLVSVVIAAFNAERDLRETIVSVTKQTYSNWELIVVDHGSTDATADIIREFAEQDPRIRSTWIAQSGRPSVARNYGAKMARGDWIAFLDADDLWLPRKMAEQIDAALTNPSIGLVYSVAERFGTTSILTRDYGIAPLPFLAAHTHAALKKRNTIPFSTAMCRAEAFNSISGFDEDPLLKAVEDWDLWLRVSAQYDIKFVPHIHVLYRVHSGGLSRNLDEMNKRIQYLCQKHKLDGTTMGVKTWKGVALVIRNVTFFICGVYVRSRMLLFSLVRTRTKCD